MLAMSQEKLGAKLGLSFQQYRNMRGAPTASGPADCSKISHILQVPVEFFFEGAPNASAPRLQ
jgi:transcriptional regulator with XRE-family HTH domain